MASTLHHLLDDPGFNLVPNDAFHHGEMLQIVMRLEKCISREKFNQNATNTPDVTGETPALIEDDFRCPVMPSGND